MQRALGKLLEGEVVLTDFAALATRVERLESLFVELETLVLKALHMRPRKERRDPKD